MLRVGLTGGLATGKSFVGHALEDLGCHLLKADELGHRALQRGGAAYEAVVAEFGPGIVGEDGEIVRKRLGAEVFSQPQRLAALNAIIHPLVVAREEEWMRDLEALEPDAIAVVEAAILIETGSHRRFDRLILTVCSHEQQVERAIKRDGLSRPEIEARLSRQMPLEEKRRYADFVVDTSGEKTATVTQVLRVYQELRSARK